MGGLGRRGVESGHTHVTHGVINEFHPAFDALHFVLLHQHGEDGWYPDLRHGVPRSRIALVPRLDLPI